MSTIIESGSPLAALGEYRTRYTTDVEIPDALAEAFAEVYRICRQDKNTRVFDSFHSCEEEADLRAKQIKQYARERHLYTNPKILVTTVTFRITDHRDSDTAEDPDDENVTTE